MNTPNHINSSTSPTNYQDTIQVDQVSRDLGITGFLTFGLICGLPGFLLMVALIDSSEQHNGWLSALSVIGVFGAIVMTIVGMFAGFVAWLMLENYWHTKNGKPAEFSGKTLVSMDDNGLNIKGLGASTWQDVITYALIPDSNSTLTVHTRAYGKLLVHDDIDKLMPILDFYLEKNRASNLSDANSIINGTEFNFKAIVFHWPKFFAWIIAGYIFAITVGFGTIFLNENISFLKSVLAVAMLVPLSAWLVWTIPFWQLSYFSASRTKSFSLKENLLSSSDGLLLVNLKLADIKSQIKSGIGYSLFFISIIPKQGKRIDLLIEAQEHAVLVNKLNLHKAKYLG